MKKYLLLTACVLSLNCGGGGPAKNLDVLSDAKINSGKVVAKAGSTELRQGFLDELAKAMPNLKEKLDNPSARKNLVQTILEQELMYQEALKKGLGESPEVAMKTLINQRSVIAAALIDNELETALKTEYEKRKDSDFTKIAIAQIVIAYQTPEAKKNKTPVTEKDKTDALKKAKEVLTKLKAGEKFEDLAKTYSTDKRTADKGGDAGHIAKVDKRFEKLGLKVVPEKAFAMKNGEVSEPLATETGYYIIKVMSEPKVTPFEDAQRTLSMDLQNQVKTDVLARLKKESPIEFLEATPEATEAPKLEITTKNGPMTKTLELPKTQATEPKTETAPATGK